MSRSEDADTPPGSPRAFASALAWVIPSLSSENPHDRAAAAERLLDLSLGAERRGAAWALAVVASGAVVPLLRSVQATPRDATTLAPLEVDAGTTAAGDAALLALSELSGVACGLLEEEGYQLEVDEESGRALFVDSESGMASSAAPALMAAEGLEAEDRWTMSLLIETLTLVTPLGCDSVTGRLCWSVEVVEHVPKRAELGLGEVSVIDMAVEGGALGERTRALVLGPWRGSDGAVEAEKDPNEPLGVALDSWRDATYVAAAMARRERGMRRVLVCGCAGGAVPQFLRTRFPESSLVVDVVERDEVVVDLSIEHFGFDCERMPAGSSAVDETKGGKPRVWCEDFERWGRRASASGAATPKYDAILGRFPEGDAAEIWSVVKALLAEDGVAAFSSVHRDAAEAMTSDDAACRLLRDPEDVTFEDVEERPEKRARGSLAAQVRERDVLCYFASSPGEDVFDPRAWLARSREKLPSGLPYAVSGCVAHGPVLVLDYAEQDDAKDEHAGVASKVDASNAAWGAFDDGDDEAGAGAASVFDAEYWNAILSAHGCSISNSADAEFVDVDASTTAKHIDALCEEGYVWGDVVIPSEQTTALRRGIDALVEAKWPPACVFVSDVAWRVIDALFAHAEVLLGGECVLEPSVAAFKLERDANGKRYIGNNFGVPHRDYSREDAVDADGRAQVLSLWLPLNRVTETSGCMYIVSKKDDPDGGRGDSFKTAPEVPRGAARALAPADAGALLAWAGNVIHWGSACAPDSPDAPRVSVAFVFRRRGDAEARADARLPPLTRADARASGLDRRLAVIRHALGTFEHWYGDASDVRARLAGRA